MKKRTKQAAGKFVNLRLLLPKEVHRRLKVAATLADVTLAETAIAVLDKHLPKIK